MTDYLTERANARAGGHPDDPRVGRHPYMGPAGNDIRACDLPGCGRRASASIHDSAPGGALILEAAKAVARAAQMGIVVAAPGRRVGDIVLSLLDQALTQAGHPTRPPSLSERTMAEVDRLKREEPEVYNAIIERHIAAGIARDAVREQRRTQLSQEHFGHTGASIPDAVIGDQPELSADELTELHRKLPGYEAMYDANGPSEQLADYQHRGQ